MKPLTGFFRDGCCNTSEEDIGGHTVCAVMTAKFLEFSKSRGNDLSTPMPELQLRPEARRPLVLMCAALAGSIEAGQAPRVVLRATHRRRPRLLRARRSQAVRGGPRLTRSEQGTRPRSVRPTWKRVGTGALTRSAYDSFLVVSVRTS